MNARNLWSIVKAARGHHLIVNAAPAVFNEIILRAALRLRSHYLDTSSHLTRHPFKAEQLRFDRRFLEKHRAAVINAGAAPGLTNLLVARSAEMLDAIEAVQVRLYESTTSDDPVSQWSHEGSFDEAVARPRIYRGPGAGAPAPGGAPAAGAPPVPGGWWRRPGPSGSGPRPPSGGGRRPGPPTSAPSGRPSGRPKS